MPEKLQYSPKTQNCAIAFRFKNTLPVMCCTSFLKLSVVLQQYSIELNLAMQGFYTFFLFFVQMPKLTRYFSGLSCRTPFLYRTSSIWRTRSVHEHCSP